MNYLKSLFPLWSLREGTEQLTVSTLDAVCGLFHLPFVTPGRLLQRLGLLTCGVARHTAVTRSTEFVVPCTLPTEPNAMCYYVEFNDVTKPGTSSAQNFLLNFILP